MPDYQYKFIRPETGRRNTGKKYAYDEAELIDVLARDGIVPVEINILPARTATEPQLAYLRSLGVSAPPVLSLEEASDLIANAKEHQMPVGSDGQQLARRFRVEVTRFVSKRTLYQRIAKKCAQEEDPYSLALWFTYRVYRANFDRSKPTQSGLDDPRLLQVAKNLVLDATALASLKRAAASPFSTGFRWFGQVHAPSGETYTGESRGTACFKFAYSRLYAQGNLPLKPRSDNEIAKSLRPRRWPAETSRGQEGLEARSGCALAAVWLLAPIVMLALAYASRWTA